jgi:hypothetical protein
MRYEPNSRLTPTSRLGKEIETQTRLHLGDEILIKESSSLGVERAFDVYNVALRHHLLETLNTTASNVLLNLGCQRLIVEV